jgi:hypothetical protein
MTLHDTIRAMRSIPALVATMLFACGGGAPDVRYPAREDGCPVRSYPGSPTIPVDDLGPVRVECRAGSGPCERQLLDAVCERGGDVAWGLGDNALTATVLVGHAAHSRRAVQSPRERGCAVRVIEGGVPEHTENVGPVTALCAEEDSADVCLRELEDQVCLLGGDVLWQVDGPRPEATSNGMRQRMDGRAAHSK